MIVKIEDIKNTAEAIIREYADYRLFVLNGEMGAGKTTFAKQFCRILGAKEEVTSPTFAIANIYTSDKFGEIYHFDFYRLKLPQEALDIGLDEYLYSGNYCLMEWPDIIIDYVPRPFVKINIQHTGNVDERSIEVDVIHK